ncbi:MAG TPA: ABC transporter permease [Thermomicrobiales bacterium]|nr:ABC transporter permease [Thermomicrobiales bacterium]
MGAYVIRRILAMPVILFFVSLITFLIINAKGNPIDRFAFNPKVRPEDIERMKHNMGLDEPILTRFFRYLSSLLHGDLGVSLIDSKPVTMMISDALPNTLRLALVSLVVSLMIAIPLAIFAAVHRNSFFDRMILTTSIASSSIPTVWLGLLLIILFAVKFREWGFPYLPINGVKDTRNPGGSWDLTEHMVLPVIALALPQIAGWIWYIRNAMIDALQQDYVRTARSLGAKERSVRFLHAFRNCLIPIITIAGLSLPDLFAGALITESVFGIPGMGRLTVKAITDNNYTVIMGTTLIYAILLLVGNLIADLLYPVVDPRLRG